MYDHGVSYLVHTLAGVKQSTERLGDVILPPWAKGDPYEFVRVNREVHVITCNSANHVHVYPCM